MVTDYEAAWLALGELVASKTQHGREALLVTMAELTASHRVPTGELSRLLRLHGVEIERARALSVEGHRDEAAASSADGAQAHSSADAGLTGHHANDGGHDADSLSRYGSRAG